MSETADHWPFHHGGITLAKPPAFRPQRRNDREGWIREMLSAATWISILRLLLGSRSRLATLFLAALVNAVVFFALVVVWISVREGTTRAAYQVLFEPSSTAAERERETRIAVAQAQLRQEVTNMGLIKQHLDYLISKYPSVARVRLAIIHNGTVGVGDNHVWKYDVIAAVAANGRVAGPLTQNDPLEGWSHFLNALLAGKCVNYPTSSIARTAGRERLDALGVKQVLTCPVRTPSGELLGAMFSLFDRDEDFPKGVDLEIYTEDARSTAAGLSYALVERRGR